MQPVSSKALLLHSQSIIIEIAKDECLREESKYHYLQNLINIARIKLERVEVEKKYQNGNGRMMRDFASLKELYTVFSPLINLTYWPSTYLPF